MIMKPYKKICNMSGAVIAAVLFMTLYTFGLNTAAEEVTAQPRLEKTVPFIAFYSRSGKTRMTAESLQKKLSCEMGEIVSKKDRTGFLGVFTCVLDQLLDRDDVQDAFPRTLTAYNPIVIAAPIWVGNLASPVRTFLKQTDIKGKDIYIIATYNGKLDAEKEAAIQQFVTAQGCNLKKMYKVITKEKTRQDIDGEVQIIAQELSRDADKKQQVVAR